MSRWTAAEADALFALRYPKFRRPAYRGFRDKDRPPRPAAGLLLRHTDADGTWFLLGRRARSLGGTWSNIGGSLNRGEDALAGAIREFAEETSIPAARLTAGRLVASIECGTDRVPYTLFVVDVPVAFDDAVLSWENTDLAWWHVDDVPTLEVHDGFARAWSEVPR